MPVQTMQGNKKYTDGLSDSSSIGSVLDDADREVSNLTDRAFRSLCISEDTSFNDSNLVISPDFAQQFFGSFQQGTGSHAIKKSSLCNRIQTHGNEHASWASTFQQLPKYVQGEEKYLKDNTPPPVSTRRKLEIPVSGLRSNKPVSKVSSLIKSFDRTENSSSDSLPPTSKHSALKTPLKCAPLPGSGVNFCVDSAFLTVRKVPAEISKTYQNSSWPGGRQGTTNSPVSNDLTSCTDGFQPAPMDASKTFESNTHLSPTKPAKIKSGKANEQASKGNFLHSENSAFESWNAHHKKLLERKEADKHTPEIKAPPNYEENPLPLREIHPSRHEISPSHTRGHMNPEEKTLAAGAPSASLSQVSNVQPGSESQNFVIEEKVPSSESKVQVETSRAPWRRSKLSKGGKEKTHEPLSEKKIDGKDPSLNKRPDPEVDFPENEIIEEQVNSNECYNPHFNISKLLTPVIPTKQVLDSLENQSGIETLPPQENSMGSSEHEGRGLNEYQSRDSYKSKVPSLLFNLKDVRKRVKSTYSASPLLKSHDEKTKARDNVKQENISNGTFMSNGSEENPLHTSSKDKLNHQPYVNTKEDHKGDINGDLTDNYLTLNSTQTMEELSYMNGDISEQNDFKNDDVGFRDPRNSDRDTHQYHHQVHEHNLMKNRPHLSLKICNRDLVDGKVEEKLNIHPHENGLPRSISQETDHERDAGSQNANFSQKISPGPLSPEEEDVFYSDTQSDFIPNLKSKAKISTSSSDQSFASFEDQHKTWFTECPREDRKSSVSLEESQKSEKREKGLRKDDLQYYSLSNGFASVEDTNKEEMSQREGESMSRDRVLIESKEEVNCRDVWLEDNKNTSLPDTKNPPLSLSPNSNKHIMFAIKDNTLKSSPVIKPIILPLLRTSSSENAHSNSHRDTESRLAEHGEDTHLYQLESQDIPNAEKTGQLVTSSSQRSSAYKKTYRSISDSGQVFGSVKAENFQPISEATLLEDDSSSPFFPIVKDSDGIKSTQNLLNKVVTSDLENHYENKEKPISFKVKPTIILPDEDSGDQPPASQLEEAHSEEKIQCSRNHLLSTLREGSLVRNIVPSEMINSPVASSIVDSSVYSPSTSAILDDTPQGPLDPGIFQGDLPNSAITSPLTSTCSSITSLASERKTSAKTAREDITHAVVPSIGGNLQLDSSADETMALSTRDALLEETSGWAAPYERPPSAVLLEKSVSKPPAVPPKTEKALRRAKKLANKRKKMDLQQEKLYEIQEESPQMEGADGIWKRPSSPVEIPQSNFPRVRSLPPPIHRHSVATLSESIRRRPSGAQSVIPMSSYPATQKKILQDPHSGEYFVFDLPLQVRMKTFYDPETGKYVKVSIPSSERGSPEIPSSEIFNSPYLVYPGLHPLPVTSLTPLRSSSQLSAPTFLRQVPQARESADHWLQSFKNAKHPSPQSCAEPIHNSPSHNREEVPQNLRKDPSEAQNLDIISMDDLEDFASEGIS
ncbi:cardiac-enriched FHL2-interacting protein [Monodelphis domestica]|uniref:cardiac-enriched FHL2-interacting protein n=1 Tax=Monodelphis domestica TaxID=13616 RepID=UPI0024E2475C|nr:cardiac-enriched FHL2-interacting protein [Monodelphis domestica]XP_056656797.1 cardiac-enriched FHL2-interacting protein [Monodelphis domestica]XP_056656808.1 cardiac-enriched FHL2-interacting protein [Monodelphis domestica]XP_056656814.1 cardiac-enriched FHL2-interacting protein [Monodelphis domestica]XP_056656820.1 cardiac-enriched FHL2-interacting protein [Monodelphis domestica]XP_056656825.1 cardiac-enriched FHL2-interacting protein [Monodelphis domestica]XP_056656827.1 cardiac-enrich